MTLPNHAHGQLGAPENPLASGRFNRMFSQGPDSPGVDKLSKLADTMYRATAGAAGDSTIPAGYTYLAQFIDHDLSFDELSNLRHKIDLHTIVDLTSPRFDLDSIYGEGPVYQPYLYTANEEGAVRMLLGRILGPLNHPPDETTPRDVPRNTVVASDNSRPSFSQPGGRALIADLRNDEHVIISQLHALFLRFHNSLADDMKRDGNKEAAFEDVRTQVRCHYQWVVLYDFLERIIDPEIYESILPHVEKKTDVKRDPPQIPNYRRRAGVYVPAELSFGAYRCAHSMIRHKYQLNPGPEGVGGPFEVIGTNLQDTLEGGRAFPDTWVIDWSLFFDDLATPPGLKLQMAQKINTNLASPLDELPAQIKAVVGGGSSSLALRDLQRGLDVRLATGQQAAKEMEIPPLSDTDLFASNERQPLQADFAGKAPLWYYVLTEAENKFDGNRLGPVGSRIVMESIVGLMLGDSESILQNNSQFKPRREYLGTGGKFRMSDLIRATHAASAPRAAHA